MTGKLKKERFSLFVKLVCLPLIPVLALSDCTAQEKLKDTFVVVTKKKEVLQSYCSKYHITIEKLHELNPQLESDVVHKGDTIFLTVKTEAAVQQQPPKPPYKETKVGKSGMFKTVVYMSKEYFVCEVNPHQNKIELFNQLEGKPGVYDLGTLARTKKKELLFAMNGGMYERDLSPAGLFVSEGKQYKPVNVNKEGEGNLYLFPNGIFLLDSTDAPYVVTTEAFLSAKYKIKLATQSGPMMVINGVFNSHFTAGSPNLNIRNAVGINKAGNVVFVISRNPVNFYEFSELFRDKLGCANALYLDGAVSQYFVPEIDGMPRPGPQLGPIITVSKKNK